MDNTHGGGAKLGRSMLSYACSMSPAKKALAIPPNSGIATETHKGFNRMLAVILSPAFLIFSARLSYANLFLFYVFSQKLCRFI